MTDGNPQTGPQRSGDTEVDRTGLVAGNDLFPGQVFAAQDQREGAAQRHFREGIERGCGGK